MDQYLVLVSEREHFVAQTNSFATTRTQNCSKMYVVYCLSYASVTRCLADSTFLTFQLTQLKEIFPDKTTGKRSMALLPVSVMSVCILCVCVCVSLPHTTL